MKKNLLPFLSLAGALILTVCSGCQTSKALSGDGIPSKKYIVGGGYAIDFTAPCAGIGYLVEEKTKKVIRLESLEKNGKFEVEISTDDAEFEKTIGIKPSAAKLTFYFVPVQEAVPFLNKMAKEE